MYLGVTTNSFQTGVSADLKAKKVGVKVTASFGYDTLIIFNPFGFEVDLKASARAKKGPVSMGISLKLTLYGPNPFRANGYAKFKICRLSKKVRFDKTFTDKKKQTPPEVSPAAELRYQLENTEIIYELPEWVNEGVVLTEDATERLSPLGVAVVSQAAVPLDTTMDKFGGGVPPENEKNLSLDVTGVGIDNSQISTASTIFAPEQYKKMSKNKRLSAPAFENYTSGSKFKGLGATPNYYKQKTVEYESRIINDRNQGVMSTNSEKFSLNRINIGASNILNSWSVQGSIKFHKPVKVIPDQSLERFVEVQDATFTVTTHESVNGNGKFKRAMINGEEVSDMTYTDAMQLAGSSEDYIVRNTAFAEE
jgi:hypothetical protein